MSQVARRVVTVGLTGGIGAGKTTALGLFAEAGAVTLSADQMVHDLYTQSKVATKIADHFGSQVLDERGVVDRTALARRVRRRRGELRWLEKLTHPLVAKEIRRKVKSAPAGAVVVCEVPLLFEAALESLFDLLVTIEAGSDSRRARSIHDFDLGQFSELESLQASTDQRVERSDLVFFNDDGLDEMRVFVQDAYARALAMLGGAVA
jgi:dephospho-CoA kinase